MKSATVLRELLEKGLVVAPGAHDGLSARLIEEAGFPAVYVGTGGMSGAVFGRPDIELTTLTELVMITRAICEAVSIPVIVDADTGFGGIHNVIRTVRDLEDAGVAGIHLEDQPVPKRCGYFEGGGLIPVGEMCDKIDAALDARRHDDFLIIARVDAAFLNHFDEAIERALAYQAVGADMVFVNGMTTIAQARQVIDQAPGMHLYNVSGSDRAPHLSIAEIADLGYRLAIYPLHAMRLSAFAMRRMFAGLASTGTLNQFQPEMVSFSEYKDLTGATQAMAVESRYNKK